MIFTKKERIIDIQKMKRLLIAVYECLYELCRRTIIRLFYRVRIMSPKRTIQYIIDHRCSVSRFGDGELSLMIDNESSIGFQSGDEELRKKLKSVFLVNNSNILICLPRYLNSVRGCTKKCKKYWRNWGRYDGLHRKSVKHIWGVLGKSYCFGDALITRPYIDCQNVKQAKKSFCMLKQIWNDRDILIVEGNKTRLGVGNDLFNGAKSIKRILAPATNAFSQYDRILDTIKEQYNGELILLALGPTATVLASDLSKLEMQALDIGHIDIEYEWFLQRATTKVAISGKYTNENIDGSNVSSCKDEKYLSQIISVIE